MALNIPQNWHHLLANETKKPYFQELEAFVEEQYTTREVFPARENIFKALEVCSPEDVKVVIMGQDPYHGDGQAHGLSFSVPEGVKFPPSLRNILREVHEDTLSKPTLNGSLERWAEQGVLLLNAVLTVEAHSAASHAGKGWEKFTDAVVEAVAQSRQGVVYMLWGSYAQKKCSIVDESQNLILQSVHPSPLSAYRGFFGCKHFSKANAYLASQGSEKIEW
ncbi:MAG: uracil-DNA glycosylase [Rikenellaceae bacterium]